MRCFWGIIFFLILSYATNAQIDSTISAESKHYFSQIDDNTYFFQQDSIQELWFLDNSANSWNLGNSTEIRTFYNNSFRLWLQGDSLSLWSYKYDIQDWKLSKSFFPEVKTINDSISYISINDTLKLVTIKERKYNFKTSNNMFFWNKIKNFPSYVVNDTVKLWKVNDSINLWTFQDSSVLWKLDNNPKIWKLSNSTIVWTLDFETEFWKAGNSFNIWKRNEKSGGWEKTDKSPQHYLDPLDIWQANKKIMLWVRNDTVQLWRANIEKKIWRSGDSLLIWKVAPLAVDTIKPDTVIFAERKVKKAELMVNVEDVKIWSVNDTIKVWDQKNRKELLFLNKSARQWKINDSSEIWNINSKSKLSLMADTLVLWEKNDSTFEWGPISSKSALKVSDSLHVFNVNDSILFTVWNDSTSLWNSKTSTNISAKSSLDQFIMINDTTELWEPNDSTKLWIDKYSEKGDIWQKNKDVNILNIDDSTKIWQISEEVRLSIISHQLKVWRHKSDEFRFPWKELKRPKRNIADSIRIWHIDDKTIIWETKHKIEVWNHQPDVQLFRLNDTSVVWTFSANFKARKPEKPKYWTLGGTGKANVSQAYLENWIKGGENSISMLFIINLMANYKKRKVKWDNDFEYRYGVLKSGEKPMRKNNDKIKFQSVFNYYAVDKWYYSFNSSIQTQIFKGFKYPTDTTSVVVSTFSGPLYSTLALGMNYFPLPQLSVFFSPFTQRFTYVRDTSIVNQTTFGIDVDKNYKNESGAIVKTVLNWNLNKNIHMLNKLDFFTSYNNNPENIDIDWELTLTFKLTKMFNTTLSTHLIYDDDVDIPKYNNSGEIIGKSPAIQFKEVLSIGLFYKL